MRWIFSPAVPLRTAVLNNSKGKTDVPETPHSVLLGGVGGYLVGVVMTRAFGVAKVAQRLELTAPRLHRGGPSHGSVGRSRRARWRCSLLHALLRAGVGGLFVTVYAALVYRFELIPPAELRRLMGCFTPAWARS